MKIVRLYLILMIVLLAWPLYGQNGKQYLYFDSEFYEYYDYLINSGKAQPDFVLRQPYELNRNFPAKGIAAVDQYFNDYSRHFYRNDSAVFQLDWRERAKFDEALFHRLRAELGVHYVSDHITLGNRTSGDQEYKRDPNFAGDLSEAESWIYGRVNEAFINLNYNQFELFFGRTKRNWGPIGDRSLILSSNPYTYDHLLFNYSSGRLKLSLIFAQLEDLGGYEFDQKGDSLRALGTARKFLAGHRLDYRFSDNLQIALTEMATYGGPGRDIELAYLNPMNFYYPIQRNDRKQMDGFWCLDVFYKPLPKMTVYWQFLLDDIVVNNDPGEDDRARYPDRLGTMLSLRGADWLVNGLNTNLTYVRIWNRTYQSMRSWESYHYRQYGLGYPCASCEEVKLKFSYWGWFPFWLRNEAVYGRYGSVAVSDIFPLKKEPYPVPPVTNNFVNHLELFYFYNSNISAFASFIYRDRVDHYSNRFSERSHFVITAGVRLSLSGALHLE